MKKYSKIALATLGLAATMTFAQTVKNVNKGKIPAAVLAAFHKDYPNVKDVDWDQEDGNYEAGFEVNKNELSVLYNAQGQKLETETEIKVSQLPAAVLKAVQTQKLGTVKEASKIEKANGKTEYEAEIKGKDYVFDASGKLLKTVKD